MYVKFSYWTYWVIAQMRTYCPSETLYNEISPKKRKYCPKEMSLKWNGSEAEVKKLSFVNTLTSSSSVSLGWALLISSSSVSSRGLSFGLTSGSGSSSSLAPLGYRFLAGASGWGFGRAGTDRFLSGTGVSSRDSSEGSDGSETWPGFNFVSNVSF